MKEGGGGGEGGNKVAVMKKTLSWESRLKYQMENKCLSSLCNHKIMCFDEQML